MLFVCNCYSKRDYIEETGPSFKITWPFFPLRPNLPAGEENVLDVVPVKIRTVTPISS